MSRVWELEERIRDLDPEALTFPDKLGGAAFIFHAEGKRFRLTFRAPSIVYSTAEGTGERVPFPSALSLPVWAIRGRDSAPEVSP